MLSQLPVSKILASVFGMDSKQPIYRKDEAFRFENQNIGSLENNFGDSLQNGRSHLDHLCEYCLDHIRPITEPIALISQIQRSGGSLLSQLFDGHQEVHAHPHELKIGYPKKYIWPKIDLNDPPERWFEILFEDIVVRHFQHGYKKMEKYEDTFPFIFFLRYRGKSFSNISTRSMT